VSALSVQAIIDVFAGIDAGDVLRVDVQPEDDFTRTLFGVSPFIDNVRLVVELAFGVLYKTHSLSPSVKLPPTKPSGNIVQDWAVLLPLVSVQVKGRIPSMAGTESRVLGVRQGEPNPTSAYRDAMLQCGFRFQAPIHPATLRHLHDFLRITEREFAREMGLQIGPHEVHMPAGALHESHVDAVRHEGQHSDGGNLGVWIGGGPLNYVQRTLRV
jgi:hypothetical protein